MPPTSHIRSPEVEIVLRRAVVMTRERESVTSDRGNDIVEMNYSSMSSAVRLRIRSLPLEILRASASLQLGELLLDLGPVGAEF